MRRYPSHLSDAIIFLTAKGYNMINKDKWGKLVERMEKFHIYETDLLEKFILGSGKGGSESIWIISNDGEQRKIESRI